LSFNQIQGPVYVPDEESARTFADVAGVDEAKAELAENRDFLKNPSVTRRSVPASPKGG